MGKMHIFLYVYYDFKIHIIRLDKVKLTINIKALILYYITKSTIKGL